MSKNRETQNRSSTAVQDDACISVVNPNDAVLEMEAKEHEETTHTQEIKRGVRKSRASLTSEPKARISPKRVKQRKPAKKEASSTKTKLHTIQAPSRPVTMSKGVAYLCGDMIKLTGGVKPHPGDEIKIKDREFVLRVGRKKRTYLYYIPAFLLLIVGLIFLSSFLKAGDQSNIIGMVTEEETGLSIPGAKVYLDEVGETVISNHLGFFMFKSLPPGSYALEVSSKGYQKRSENVTIHKDESITLNLNLKPISSGDLSSASPTKAETAKGSGKRGSSSERTTGSKYGAVKIESNVSDPTILIDNRLAGVGNDIYRDIQPGKHVIAVTKDGYFDWAQEVRIKSGKISSLKVTLSEDKTTHPDVQTWKDFVDLGNNQLNSNDFTSALNSYNQALDLKPDAAEALQRRGYVYLQMADRAKAAKDFEKSAGIFIQEHQYQKAALSYTNLIDLNDGDLNSYLHRGVCYLNLGEYKNSIKDMKKALTIDPDLFSAHLNLGEAYYKAGECKLSIESYKRAKKIDSKSLSVYVGLTKAYFAQGDESKAKKSYKKFEELSTYIYREKMKHDPEWQKILEGIGVEAQPKL
jgi:tetratricopeptide (TPR) repeat protein